MAAANAVHFSLGSAEQRQGGQGRQGSPGRLCLLAQGLSLGNPVLPRGALLRSVGLRSPRGTEALVNEDPGSRERQSGKEAPGPGHLQMRQEGITHIPPIRTCVPLEQSRSCFSVQPGLGTGSQLLWEHCGSLSFPTVSTCLEVTSYDLQGNPVSRFYCPEKEMGMINQCEDKKPLPSPLRSLQPQRTHSFCECLGSVPRSRVP